MTPASSAALDAPALERTLTPFVEQTMGAAGVPGVQVAAVAGGRLVWSRGFGLADVEHGIPVDTQTVFPARSISKVFTATLIMREVEAERIGLDDDVNRYLEPARRIRHAGKETAVTVRQLLSHSSGLPVAWLSAGEIWAYLLRRPPPTLDEKLASGLRLVRQPGRKIVYANSGFWLLGWLAAHLDGARFEDLAQQSLLEPLGMTSSDFRPATRLLPRLAQVYLGRQGRFTPITIARAIPPNPAASLLTTAEDLMRFARMVLGRGELEGRRYLNAESLATMATLQVRQHPALEAGYGLGFFVSRHRGRPMIAHDGGDLGISTRLAILPTEDMAVAVLTNAGKAAATHRITERLLDALLGEPVPPARRPVPREPMPAAWRRLGGRYRFVDICPPWLAAAEYLTQIRIAPHAGVLRLSGGAWLGSHLVLDHVLEPTDDPHVFVLRGSPFEGERIAFAEQADGTMAAFFDLFELRRVPAYAALPVIAVAAGLTALGAVGLALRWVGRRYRRRSRPRPRGSPPR